jgi:hypothetical protein
MQAPLHEMELEHNVLQEQLNMIERNYPETKKIMEIKLKANEIEKQCLESIPPCA